MVALSKLMIHNKGESRNLIGVIRMYKKNKIYTCILGSVTLFWFPKQALPI